MGDRLEDRLGLHLEVVGEEEDLLLEAILPDPALALLV
jgi:hypothetical protein